MIKHPPNFWDVFKKTPGALSSAESIAISTVASMAPKGTYMELGVHRGKSTMSALQGLGDGFFILVDPIFEDEAIINEVVGTLAQVNPQSIQLNFVANYSTNVIPNHNHLSFVFCDSGSHSDEIPMEEVKLLEDRVVSGGIIAFHDRGSQFLKVDEAFDYLVSTGKYDPIFFDWEEIFKYVEENGTEISNNSWHQYPELGHPPNFVGALRKK